MAVDGEPLGPVALLERLNAVGGRHGVGRVDAMETGRTAREIKSRFTCSKDSCPHRDLGSRSAMVR